MQNLIAIYGRVSTEKQTTDGYGLDVQLNELVNEAESKGLSHREYIDSGISGTSIDKREGLQRMIQDLKTGEISEVWVTKLSRLGRNSRDVLNIIHEFEVNDVVFKSVRDGIDTSNPTGRIMLQFMSIIAEMERDVIIETTRAGAEYRAALGKIYGSPPIYGYDRIGMGRDSYLEINEPEAKVIKNVYELYSSGFGYKAIVSKLNLAGFRGKTGNLFSINTVKRILTNPLYVGKIRYNFHKEWNKKRRKGKQLEGEYILVEGTHEAIVKESIWNKIQTKISKNKGKRKPASGKFLLDGVLKCPKCGTGMVGISRTSKRKSGDIKINYYICGANHNKGRVACSANSIRASKVEAMVLEQVSNYLQNDELPEMLYEFIVANTVDINQLPGQIKALRGDISSIDKKIERVKEMYEEGFIEKSEMKAKLTKFNGDSIEYKLKIDELKSQMDEIDMPDIDITVEEIRDILSTIYKTLSEESDRLLLKKFLKVVIDNIQIINRKTANMKVNMKFTEELLKLFNKEVPDGASFSISEEI